MEQIKIISYGSQNNNTSGCGECQASCQSACKTSCTVGNQACEQINSN